MTERTTVPIFSGRVGVNPVKRAVVSSAATRHAGAIPSAETLTLAGMCAVNGNAPRLSESGALFVFLAVMVLTPHAALTVLSHISADSRLHFGSSQQRLMAVRLPSLWTASCVASLTHHTH